MGQQEIFDLFRTLSGWINVIPGSTELYTFVLRNGVYEAFRLLNYPPEALDGLQRLLEASNWW